MRIISKKRFKAKKVHTCSICGIDIQKGENYVRVYGEIPETQSMGAAKLCTKCDSTTKIIPRRKPA